jgi:hypothetical protein
MDCYVEFPTQKDAEDTVNRVSRAYDAGSAPRMGLVSEKAIKTGRPTVFVDKLDRLSTLPRNALRPGNNSSC